MINLIYTCAALDSSGYSEASRNYIASLNAHPDEVNFSVNSTNFERWPTDHAEYMSIIRPLLVKKVNPRVQIVHMTPDNFPKYRKRNLKNIGYAAWETSILPKRWVPMCNVMDEIWVPSQWNKDVFEQSGVTVPVKKIEHAINVKQFEDNVSESDLGIPKDKFVFYSIFQWTERKNPIGLIKAFLSEFSKDDDVCLVLKSYVSNVSKKGVQDLNSQVTGITNSMFLNGDHAPIHMIQNMLSRQEMISLHNQGDCFVLPARSEGFGIPFLEAMAAGKPTIGTNYSGNVDFMNSKNSYLLDYTLTPVSFMPWQLYNGKAEWAEPDLSHFKKTMRQVYENQDEAKEKGLLGKKVAKDYSWENVGRKMIDTINS